MSAVEDICRVCRKTKNDATSFVRLFLEQDGDNSLPNMFEFVASISITAEDTKMPQEICTDCLQQLKASYNFRKLCIESDELLRKKFDVKSVAENKKTSASKEPPYQQIKPSVCKPSTIYLDDYDPSFYQIVVDRFHYMELAFIAERCCGCLQAFASTEALQDHSWSVHQKQQQESGLGPRHQCQICFNAFPYEETLNFHRQSVQGNWFCCRECFTIFDKKPTLFNHLRHQHHRNKAELERELDSVMTEPLMGHSIFDPEPDYSMNQHSQAAVVGGNGMGHSFGHSIAKPYPATNLRVSFVQSLAVEPGDTFNLGYCEISHSLKLSHLRPSQYKVAERSEHFSIIEFTWHRCCACNHMFSSYADLEIHCTEEHRKQYIPGQSHLGLQKPFMCEQCWRRFKKKSLLGLHQKFNRKKVYSCNTCLHFFFGGPAFEKHLPDCIMSSYNGMQTVDPVQLTSAADADGVANHQMVIDLKEESDDDDDVYILND